MTVSRPTYCTREAVKARPNIQFTAGVDPYVDDAIERASDSIDGGKTIGGQLGRRFYPETGTREIPRAEITSARHLWLPRGWELASLAQVTAITAGGDTIAASEVQAWPPEPPHWRLDVKPSSSASFLDGDEDAGVAVTTTGWNYPSDTRPAGTLTEALDASETGVDVSNSAAVGVGDVIIVDSERMLVTDRGPGLDTGQNLGGSGLTAQANSVAMTVADGTGFAVGETLTVETERVRVDGIAGNVLTVKRAVDGSVLAAHSAGADIYAPRTLTVQRGALGSTAATHLSGTAVLRHVVSAAVRSLGLGEAIHTMLSEPHGYARIIGEGDAARESSGRGLAQLRKDAYESHGCKRLYKGAI
jgi:hypothetical protein